MGNRCGNIARSREFINWWRKNRQESTISAKKKICKAENSEEGKQHE
jgi:hypothetical protein